MWPATIEHAQIREAYSNNLGELFFALDRKTPAVVSGQGRRLGGTFAVILDCEWQNAHPE
ncbi:MAG: hypothetical protein WBG92_18380 [Thiohalocapsa sp.]